MSGNFTRNINKLKQNLNAIGETTELHFDELFNPEFLTECSSFVSLEDMLAKSGFKIENTEDFKAIPDDEWEKFIKENTSYESWAEMQSDAATKLLQQRLMAGLQ